MMNPIQKRLTDARTGILIKYPFFGLLLMRVKFAVADCGTAFTNMEHIVVDPKFVGRLDDEELEFLLLHEIMHIILNHCTRGRGLNQQIYNIACDIVVNSNLMNLMRMDEMCIDGEPVMHYAPDGSHGFSHDAETVYEMLMKQYQECDQEGDSQIDTHEPWQNIPEGSYQEEAWKEEVRSLGSQLGMTENLPPGIRRRMNHLSYKPVLDWKTLLHEFMKLHFMKEEESFSRPDNRFMDYGVLLPSLCEEEVKSLENLWFCVDTSASVEGNHLRVVFEELKSAIRQCKNLEGKLSFFDTKVSEPQEFSTVEDLEKCEPVGGGGTSFYSIFRYMIANMTEKLPRAIVILTDGYAMFPPEQVALDVAVLWIIVKSEVKPPWGKCARVD